MSSVFDCGIVRQHIIDTQEIPKEVHGLRTHEVIKCNSYVAYCMRQIIVVDLSLPQCKRMHVRQCPQLLGGGLTINLVIYFLILLALLLYR